MNARMTEAVMMMMMMTEMMIAHLREGKDENGGHGTEGRKKGSMLPVQ